MKAAFHTLGCKVNTYETEAMKQQLKSRGYDIVSFNEDADVYIINTCTVTNIADQKSRQMIHKAKKKNPDAVIVAAGCYVQASKEALLKDKTADLIIGNNLKTRLADLLEAYMENPEVGKALDVVEDLSHEHRYESMTLVNTEERTRAFLKIQDGCNQFCSYCLIPFARGRARSEAPEKVLEQIRILAEQGYKEVVLTGIHLDSYGKDLNEEKKSMLLPLILDTAKIPGIERIRLGSLEPNIITEEFVKALAECPQFCPHFHLSLQSGCNETLKRMNRHYTAEKYLESCRLIRAYFEHPAITTDVIVGFPGETEEEFETTCRMVKEAQFAEMHVFKYSRRKGTRADVMENQIPEQVKTERSHRLLAIASEMQKEYVSWYLGKTVEVLTEDEFLMDGSTYREGHTKTYVKCLVQAENPNEILKAAAQKVLNNNTILTVPLAE